MATRTCTNGACTGTCAPGYSDCNGDLRTDGCETQGPCLYWASGVQNNVPTSALLGWTLCFSDNYASSSSIATMQANCNQAKLLMACAPVGSSVLNVVAMAPRSDVFSDVGNGNQFSVHPANGVNWYFSTSWSMGFAPGGAGVNRFSCDTVDSSGGPTANQRICWHTSLGQVSNGWRCGQAASLNSAGWARLIYQSPY
jgi:hypothetical protein